MNGRSAFSFLVPLPSDDFTAVAYGCDGLEVQADGAHACCVFRNVDFGEGATGFAAEARISECSGWIDIRLDSPSGARVGACQVAKRDIGLHCWAAVATGVYTPAGVHDVYLGFRGFGRDGLSLRNIRFMADRRIGFSPGGVPLPDRAPWLGPQESYFIGNGIVGGGGDTKGIWDYLIGPGYTFHGYIKSHETFVRREEIILSIDDRETRPDFAMRRVRGTGMFFGCAEASGVRFLLLEYSNRGEPWVCRLIHAENITDSIRVIAVKAELQPDGIDHAVIGGRAVSIDHSCDDESANKHAVIGFPGPLAAARRVGEVYELSAGAVTLRPQGKDSGVFTTALLHAMHRQGDSHSPWADATWDISQDSLLADAGRSIMEWQEWFASGEPLGSPGRTSDLLEGALAIIRMLQGEDGGIMATARSYMDSYIRDSAGAVSGLAAYGFSGEVELFLRWAHREFGLHHTIVCNANIGDDANWFPGYGDEDNWAAESPALYLLAARDYLRCMQKKGREPQALRVLGELDDSLRYAAEVQVASLIKNGWKLRFNGDETESGGAGIPLADRYTLDGSWSMASLALCIPSLEFYAGLLRGRGVDLENYKSMLTEEPFYFFDVIEKAKESMDTNFWRTDLDTYGGGFYDWYRNEDGGWPTHRITNFSLFPLCYKTSLNCPERAESSARAMLTHFNTSGYLPIQPDGLNDDFCGHNLGYLLHALAMLGDGMVDTVFEELTGGGTMGCWGTWSEAYTGDGVTHSLPDGTRQYRVANMRPFETGVNIAAIRVYQETIGQHPCRKYPQPGCRDLLND